jgi:hypothetical protein
MLLPSRRKGSGIYDRSKGGATLLQNLRSGGNVASKPEKEQQDLRPEQGRGNVAAESAQRKSSGIYDRSKGGATLLQNLRNGGNVASKPAQRGKKSKRIYDRSKGRATLLQNLRSGGNVASKPEKEKQDLRTEQGRGNVAAESAQWG